MGDIFREIDDELRQERLEKFWKLYGRYIIAAAVAVVVAVAGVTFWNQYQESQRVEDATRFDRAVQLSLDGKKDEAAALFASIAEGSRTTFGSLARFHQAGLLVEQGNIQGAAELYDGIADDSAIGQPYRDLATILSSLAQVSDPAADTVALRQRLGPLAEQSNPWRHSAAEILGLLAQREGNEKEAAEFFRRIVDDPDAPRNVRTRASQMLSILGG